MNSTECCGGFDQLQRAIAGIGETLCLEHNNLLGVSRSKFAQDYTTIVTMVNNGIGQSCCRCIAGCSGRDMLFSPASQDSKRAK